MSVPSPTPARRLDARVPFLLVNVIGGVSVLGSYAWGIATHPETAGDLWGSIPASVIPLYTGCMPFKNLEGHCTQWQPRASTSP